MSRAASNCYVGAWRQRTEPRASVIARPPCSGRGRRGAFSSASDDESADPKRALRERISKRVSNA
jgi:hypothetical protein